MIALVHVVVPYSLAVPLDSEFSLFERSLPDSGHTVRVLPPAVTDTPPADAPDSATIDETESRIANALVFEFRKSEFERRVEEPIDPTPLIIQDAANWFLARLRYVTRAQWMRPIDIAGVSWRIRYLNDDGSELTPSPGYVRGRFATRANWALAAVTPKIWNALHSLPDDFVFPEWMALLLDAAAALPDVGVAVALASTGLEVFASWLLDAVAPRAGVSPALWKWITDRDWLKAPSMEEQYDALLQLLLGASLKTQPTLWSAFKNLKQARNNFVHEGIPRIGSNPLTLPEAGLLVSRSVEIVAWVRGLLPEDLRWPEFPAETKIEVRKILLRVGENAPGA